MWVVVGGRDSPGQLPASGLDLDAPFENQVSLTEGIKKEA